MDIVGLLVELVRVRPSPHSPHFDITFPRRKECERVWRIEGVRAHVDDDAIELLQARFWEQWPKLRENLLTPKRRKPVLLDAPQMSAPKRRGNYLFVRPPEIVASKRKPLLIQD